MRVEISLETGHSRAAFCLPLVMVKNRCTGYAKKPGPLCFTACNFRNIDKICIKFGTNQSHFILNIKS